jgi:hypothetical protein
MRGYIYCFANDSMPGICKIGMTTRTVEERLREANFVGTWRPPTPYTCMYVKEVENVSRIERQIHEEFEKMGLRVSERSEFFKTDVNMVRNVVESIICGKIGDEIKGVKTETSGKRCFAGWFETYLKDGQEIRHIVGETKIWLGRYCKANGTVICDDGSVYGTIRNFCISHMRAEIPHKRQYTMNNWRLCQIKCNYGAWVSVPDLKEFMLT